MKKIILIILLTFLIFIILLTSPCFPQDIKPPKILKAYLAEKLLVTFNEPMDSTVLNLDNYFICPLSALQPDQVEAYSIVGINSDLDSVILYIELKKDPGIYRLVVSDVFDTSGNLINLEKNFAIYKK